MLSTEIIAKLPNSTLTFFMIASLSQLRTLPDTQAGKMKILRDFVVLYCKNTNKQLILLKS